MATSVSTSTTTITVVVGTIVLSAPLFYRVLRYIADYAFGVKRSQDEELEGLHVLIKTSDKTVPIFLSPKWSIGDVKSRLASAVGKEAEELRIIVAGHELRDDVIVGDCDLGQSTVIHAVKVLHRPIISSNENVHNRQKEFVKNLDEVGNSFDNSTVGETKSTSNDYATYTGDKPMNECLLDLQLTEEERVRFENDNAQSANLSDITTVTEKHSQDALKNTEVKPIIDGNIKERIRAHFWVYCSRIECGRTLQPGKLRVRCSSCKEGAIIVKSDPCNWDDVLNSGQIEGYCQNNNCTFVGQSEINHPESIKVRGAEFYFKCSGTNHHGNISNGSQPYSSNLVNSSDTDTITVEAPPLYLIRSNLKEIPCLGKQLCDLYFYEIKF